MKTNIYTFITLLLILIVWQGISLVYPPVMVPGPYETIIEFLSILKTEQFYYDVYLTFERLGIAILLAVIIGSIAGFGSSVNEKINKLLNPLINMLQAVPPISWLAVALIWFGVNEKASIFIVVMATIPIITITVIEGMKNIDVKLIHMGKIYGFTFYQTMWHIVLPALYPYLKSGLEIVLGLGWKIVIMGEVLSCNTGIGAEITEARLNVNTAKLFALTVIVVMLYFMVDKLMQKAFNTKYSRVKEGVYDINP